MVHTRKPCHFFHGELVECGEFFIRLHIRGQNTFGTHGKIGSLLKVMVNLSKDLEQTLKWILIF